MLTWKIKVCHIIQTNFGLTIYLLKGVLSNGFSSGKNCIKLKVNLLKSNLKFLKENFNPEYSRARWTETLKGVHIPRII